MLIKSHIEIIIIIYIFSSIIINTKNVSNTTRIFGKDEPSINRFQFKLLKTLIDLQPTDNIVISPISIHQILSIISNGALGATQKEIVSSLSSTNIIQLNQESIENNKLNNHDSSSLKKVQISNGIFAKCQPKQSFLEVIKSKYNSTIEKLVSVEQINQWISNKTNNKINHMVDNIDNITMLLINAVTFKDNWEYPFQIINTKKGLFDGTQNVLIMHQRYDTVKYYENKFIQIIELPYFSSHLGFVIMLPASDININQFASSLNYRNINEFLSLLDYQSVDLFLPKFEVNYDIILNDAMQRLGMKEAFDANNAKFGNICEDNDLFISYIKQKSYLKINEFGTDALTATTVHMGKMSIPPTEYKTMNIDRPFFFGIRNLRIKNMFMFMGIIKNINIK